MTVLKGILFVICLFMGIFFTVFVLTAVEAKSQKFQNFAGKVFKLFSDVVWLIITVLFVFAMSLIFLYLTDLDSTRCGIFAGLISGIPFYFKAGPNINRQDMEKAARDNPIAPKGIFSFLAGPDMDEIKAKRAKDKAKADPYQKRNKSDKDKKKK